MITIQARFEVPLEEQTRILSALQEMASTTPAHEPTVFAYPLHRSQANPLSPIMFEIYADGAPLMRSWKASAAALDPSQTAVMIGPTASAIQQAEAAKRCRRCEDAPERCEEKGRDGSLQPYSCLDCGRSYDIVVSLAATTVRWLLAASSTPEQRRAAARYLWARGSGSGATRWGGHIPARIGAGSTQQSGTAAVQER